MAKTFKIFCLFLALGIFLLPNQMVFAYNSTEMTCCKNNTDKKDCCKKNQEKQEKPCHNDEKDSPCNNCTTCSNCHLCFIVFEASQNLPLEISPLHAAENKKISTFSPEISHISFKIWQPPKIG